MSTDSTFAIILGIVLVAIIYLYFSMRQEAEKRHKLAKYCKPKGRTRHRRGKTFSLHGMSELGRPM